MSGAAGVLGPIFNSANATVTISAWIVAAGFVLIALAVILAVVRGGLPATLAIAAAVMMAGGGSWIWLDHQRAAERGAIESRLAELQARAQVPGSVLACLESSAGDAVDAGCEISLFGSPEAVAAASSYTAALFAFSIEAQKIAVRRGTPFESNFERARRLLEQDRFGILANHLAVQEGCSADRCDLLVLLRDPTKVQANLEQRTFDDHITRYAAAWGTRVARVPPSSTPAAAPAAFTIGSAPVGAPASAGKPLPPDYVLPSSESIPAISIMSNEPTREPSRANAPADDGATQPRRPQRAAQARSRSSNESSAPAPGAPLSLTQ
jgi:hypothetical protein